jgi:hypothetical protein
MKADEQINQRIAELEPWRGQRLARLRELVQEVDPDLTEEWKWNNPAWSRNGLIFGIVAETKKAKEWVQVTFFQGAFLDDPQRLFNAGFESKSMRYIKIREGDSLDETALQDLMRAAVAYNTAGK